MITIKLLQDNTVFVKWPDGTTQTVNSTHSHKAASPLIKAVCDAFPYKGAMEFSPDYVAPVFTFDNCHDCPDVLKEAMGDLYTEILALKKAVDGQEAKQETRLTEKQVETVEIVDGQAVISTITEPTVEKVFDEIPCVCSKGNPIMEEVEPAVEAKPAVLDDNGEVLEPEIKAVPAVLRQRVHKVPRMIPGKAMSATKAARLKTLIGR